MQPIDEANQRKRKHAAGGPFAIQVQRVCPDLALIIKLLNDPNLHLVHMQETGGEIHQYTFAPR
jgi:hypothetical protein